MVDSAAAWTETKVKAKAQAIVVGSGPAGAAAAQGLVDAGADVMMLEAGGRPTSERFGVMERALLGQIPWVFEPYPYEMNGDDVELNVFALRKLGGSSLAWGAITPRYHPNDFRMKSRYGVGEDWPMTYNDLDPYYGAAEAFMGVSGADDNPWTPPRSTPYPMPPFPMNDTDRAVKAACDRLGIQLHSVPVARNSTTYRGRSACCYYGTCRACPIGAMYSSDQTIALLELRSNFRLILHAEAIRIEVDDASRARRVIYLDADGREHAAEAEKIILAVQCVEAVRLLRNSHTSRFKNGLGNNNGILGRYFLEHAKFYVMGRVKERLTPYQQGFETATTFKFHDHSRRGEYAGGRLLVRENAGPSVPQIAIRSGLWGRELKAEINQLFGHYVTLGAFLEQLPNEHNRIDLSRRVRGRAGLPGARVDFKLVGEYEQQGFLQMKHEMGRILDAMGAEEVRCIMAPANSGHYMGGHRMGTRPEESVTDGFLELHDVPGLYLATAGAFPTSGISNPTLTTVALVFRMVDRILERV